LWLVPWSYRPALDGLRSVAVYLVLLFHTGMSFAGGGFIGVDLFFVLSGFLVTNVILSEVDGPGACASAASTPGGCAGCCPRRWPSWSPQARCS
jgi:peptidoglycan/LPS O-acetylase OafA/YrhL